jgi:hypothetical protein
MVPELNLYLGLEEALVLVHEAHPRGGGLDWTIDPPLLTPISTEPHSIASRTALSKRRGDMGGARKTFREKYQGHQAEDAHNENQVKEVRPSKLHHSSMIGTVHCKSSRHED